jgi:hypothetical protein
VTGLRIDTAANVLKGCGIVAGNSRYHAIGITQRHHAGGEMVAVVVDQALGVAKQVALPLQPRVEIIRVGAGTLGNAGIDELDARPVEIDAFALRRFAHPVFAAK